MEEEDEDLTQPSSWEARVQKVTAQRREARKERDTYKSQVEQLTAKLGEYEQQLAATAEIGQKLEHYQKLESAWATEKAIMGKGITNPEGVEFVRMAYGRLGEDRPALDEWLGNTESLPLAVKVYLPQQEPEKKAPVDPDKGARPHTGAPAGNFSQQFRSGKFSQEDLNSVWGELGIEPPKFD